MTRWWPRSLQGRMVLILVIGVLAAQLLTSSIWYEVRQTQVLEIPLRLLAGRMADLLRVAHDQPAQLPALLDGMESSHWHRLATAPSHDIAVEPAHARLLQELLAARTEGPAPVRLLALDIVDSEGRSGGAAMLLRGAGERARRGRTDLARWPPAVPASHRRPGLAQRVDWLAGVRLHLRIYLLRSIAVVLIALLAVRLALRPLKQMAAPPKRWGRISTARR
jgi:hypothetical protein